MTDISSQCNRKFPCNHCRKRGVSHLCRFVSKAPASKSAKDDRSNNGQSRLVPSCRAVILLLTGSSTPGRTSRKRSFVNPGKRAAFNGDPDDDLEASDIDVMGALNGLGYMSHHHHLVLGHGNGPRVGTRDPQESCTAVG